MDRNNLADRNIPKSERAEGKYGEGKRYPTWNSLPPYNSFPRQNLSPSKNCPTTFHFFLKAVYIVMVTYQHHLMDVINFNYSLTPFHKPKQTEKVTSCTRGLQLLEGTFWLKNKSFVSCWRHAKNSSITSASAATYWPFRAPGCWIIDTSYSTSIVFFQGVPVFLRCYDVGIAICITIFCRKGATYCTVSQRLQLC